MQVRDVWWSDQPLALLFRTALTPASWLYALGWQTYLALYQTGIKKSANVHRPILCVGNLTVGGSGKSPVVGALANLLLDLGYEVVISASGYGSPGEHAASLAPTGPLSAHQWGDEPAMFRDLLPGVPLIVGRRRVLAAELCALNFPQAVLLLDDGFQHLPLTKHVQILLDEPHPSNGRCLPAGPCREPRANRSRADLILPGAFTVRTNDLTFLDATSSKTVEVPTSFNVLCGLGRPDRFLAALPWPPTHVKLLPDHDDMLGGNLWSGLSEDHPIVVTMKDWVKLRERSDLVGKTIIVCRHSVRIEGDAEFRRWIVEKLDGSGAQKRPK